MWSTTRSDLTLVWSCCVAGGLHESCRFRSVFGQLLVCFVHFHRRRLELCSEYSTKAFTTPATIGAVVARVFFFRFGVLFVPHACVYADHSGRRRQAQAPGRAERAGVVHQPLREPHRAEKAGDQLAAQDPRLGVRRGDRAAEETGHRLQGIMRLDCFFVRRVSFWVPAVPNRLSVYYPTSFYHFICVFPTSPGSD